MAGIGWSLPIVPPADGEFGGLAHFSLRLVDLEDSAERDARQFTTLSASGVAKIFGTRENFALTNGDQPCVKLPQIELP